MSKIEDLLNRTVRKETEITRSIVVTVITIVLSITIGSLLGIFYLADVDKYLQDNKETINLYDFYDRKFVSNETAVFFIGSSIVGHSIYPLEINRIVKKDYPNITAYNLFESGDIPIERSLEIQKIIDAKPSLVIYGISYRSVTDKINPARFFERTKLVHSRLSVREDSLWLYTAYEQLYFTPLSDFGKRKYLFSAIDYKFSGEDRSINYSLDPYWVHREEHDILTEDKNASIIKKINDPNSVWCPVVTNESTRYKDALIYNVKTLQDAGVPVIILNMPLHPLLSEKITDESRANFYNLLNETGAEWYDLERDYGDDFFVDDHHASFDGALKFAPRMAELLIEQVEKDVIHYT